MFHTSSVYQCILVEFKNCEVLVEENIFFKNGISNFYLTLTKFTILRSILQAYRHFLRKIGNYPSNQQGRQDSHIRRVHRGLGENISVSRGKDLTLLQIPLLHYGASPSLFIN